MNKVGLFLLLIFFSNYAQSQNKYEQMWDNISLSSDEPIVSDTMLVLNTTRAFNQNAKIVFSQEIDQKHDARVVLAVCIHQKWKLYIMNDINTAMNLMPTGKNLVVYVEGVGKSFPLAMYRAAGITTQHGVNVIMFDYPTLKESFTITKSYFFALKNVKQVTQPFNKFIYQLQSARDSSVSWMNSNCVTLFIHSMGNRLLKETIVKESISKINTKFFSKVVLNAPCVNQYHHAQWINSINFSSEIFINYNRKDFKLKGAMLLSHRLVLGSYVHKPYSSKAIYVNMAEVLNSSHNGFIYNPGRTQIPKSSQQYYSRLFHCQLIDFNDELLFGKIGTNSYFLK